MGREPTPEEIAEKMDMPLEKVRKVLKIAKEPISLETPIGDEEDSHLGDFIEDKNADSADRRRDASNLRETTTRVLAYLDGARENACCACASGSTNTDHTLEEVGQHFYGDPRTHSPDRSQGASQAETSFTLAEAAEFLG